MIEKITCKGMIFDVDATLVDTTNIINYVWKVWSKSKNRNFSEVYPHIHGRKINETLRCVCPSFENKKEEMKLTQKFAHEMKSAKSISGAHRFVQHISDIDWAIVTSGPRKIASTSLSAAGFNIPCVTICAEDVNNGKPHPEPFLKAVNKLGLLAHECVAFEDSPSGIASAKAAGCLTIALKTSHSCNDLQAADLVINDFNDIKVLRKEHIYLITSI
ncbi:HAD-IA family hydrolase [Lentisphaerota bacterium ZTH]|nr:HAD-IA family hydrolase [Lentisphaerota bacterium]WET06066.1 HAD-IA family hydrolase [Lentisphaerota bacterium ZTH]